MNLIKWCDEKITILKENDIKFLNGRPCLPEKMIYDNVPKYIETYQFRNEIPLKDRSKTLICFYSDDKRLWRRLITFDEDCKIFSKYAGIVGMDLSPSVNMLKPRQLQSILINSIYNCLIAIRGIKVAISARLGDLSTNVIIDEYSKNKTLIFGNLGCKGNFLNYSYIQFSERIKNENPNNVCIYGSLSAKDIKNLEKFGFDITINLFLGHNYRNVNNKKSVFTISGSKYTTNIPSTGHVLNYILSQGIRKSKQIEHLKNGGHF